MISIASILPPERTIIGLNGSSKKKVFEIIGETIAKSVPELNADEIYQKLFEREQLGSTGLGHGVAIPHCRLNSCHQIIGALFRLEHPIKFDAIDDQPVDLLFALIVPEEASDEHLQVLAKLANLFSQKDVRNALRASSSSAHFYETTITLAA